MKNKILHFLGIRLTSDEFKEKLISRGAKIGDGTIFTDTVSVKLDTGYPYSI